MDSSQENNMLFQQTPLVAEGGIAITEDESFSLAGYQVVRGEFFAHIYEPSLTFNDNKVYVNTACVKKLPSVDYVLIMVNPDTKKVAIRPCAEDVKDAVRWCSATAKRSPKQMTAKIPIAMVYELMNWNRNFRYKLLGKLIKTNNALLFVFDLNTPEIFVKKSNAEGKETSSRTPTFPDTWKNQFGVPVEEHQNKLQIDTFDGYTIFNINQRKQKNKAADSTTEANPIQPDNNHENIESVEEKNYEQTTIFQNTEDSTTNNSNRSDLQIDTDPQINIGSPT